MFGLETGGETILLRRMSRLVDEEVDGRPGMRDDGARSDIHGVERLAMLEYQSRYELESDGLASEQARSERYFVRRIRILYY